MSTLNICSILFCLVYSYLNRKNSSLELILANLSFLLISGFFNNLI